LRDKERRRRRTKEVALAFRTFRPCVTRHKRGTKQQDGKREKAQGEPQQSEGSRLAPPRLSRAKVAKNRQRNGRAGTAAEWRQREPRRPGDTTFGVGALGWTQDGQHVTFADCRRTDGPVVCGGDVTFLDPDRSAVVEGPAASTVAP